MGMLGAMAGVGRGIQGYAGAMKEQQKMDWQSQQGQVAYERQMNLENLRASNQAKRDEASWGRQREAQIEDRDFRSQEAEAQRGFLVEQENDRRDWEAGQKVVAKSKDGIAITLSELEDMTAEERKSVMSPEAYQAEVSLRQVEEQAKLVTKLEEEKRAKAVAKLREVWGADGISPTEEARLLSIEMGMDFTDMLKTQRPPSAEMIKEINTLLQDDETFINADSGGKIQMVTDAYHRLIGAPPTGAQHVLTPKAKEKIAQNPDAVTEEDYQKLNEEDKAFVDNLKGKKTGVLKGKPLVPGPKTTASSYQYGKPGRKLYDFMNRTFGSRDDEGAVSEKQRQAVEIYK